MHESGALPPPHEEECREAWRANANGFAWQWQAAQAVPAPWLLLFTVSVSELGTMQQLTQLRCSADGEPRHDAAGQDWPACSSLILQHAAALRIQPRYDEF